MDFTYSSTVALLWTETLDLTACNDSAANSNKQDPPKVCDTRVPWKLPKNIAESFLTGDKVMDSIDGEIVVPTFTTIFSTGTSPNLGSFDSPELLQPSSVEAVTSVLSSATAIRARSSVTLGVTVIPDTCTDAPTCEDIPPPRALVIFYTICIVLLLLILLGYLIFIAAALIRAWPNILERRRNNKAATKVAQRNKTSRRGPRIDSMGPPPVIIGESRKRSRDNERGGNDARIGTHEHVESYEMDEFYAPQQRHYSRNQSPHVNRAGAADMTPSRSQGSDGGQRRARREAMLWDHLKTQNINDVDDETRIAALQQLRHSQMPSQTNFGDDNVWSPITTTEELSRIYRDRRQQR